jgi:predicted nucleic acid-binding protein
MENMVIDTSALIATILDEPEKNRLIELTRGTTLLAPGSQPWEMGNALAAMSRKGHLELKDALAALDVFHSIPVQFVDVNLAKALEIAHTARIYAYDAYMIVCAVDYQAPLLTLDRSLARQARVYNISVPEI